MKYFPTIILEYASMLAIVGYLTLQVGQTVAGVDLHLLNHVTALLAR